MNIFVKTTYANIYDKPTFSSSMVTQALLWEKLEVLSSKGSWFKVKQWDEYISQQTAIKYYIIKRFIKKNKRREMSNIYDVLNTTFEGGVCPTPF